MSVLKSFNDILIPIFVIWTKSGHLLTVVVVKAETLHSVKRHKWLSNLFSCLRTAATKSEKKFLERKTRKRAESEKVKDTKHWERKIHWQRQMLSWFSTPPPSFNFSNKLFPLSFLKFCSEQLSLLFKSML
jgi:hypothetical protein